jgi:predicted S18 family serine protease
MLTRLCCSRVVKGVLMIAVLALGACAKPPTQEITQAEKAIEEATQKEAGLYAQDLLQKAQDSLKKAKDLVTQKKYDDAKKAAEEAANFAKQAIPAAEQNKAKLKAEAEQMVPEIQKALDELKALVAKSGKRLARNEAAQINEMVKKWGTDLAGAQKAIQEQKFQEAADQLKKMKEAIDKQKERLTPLPPEKGKDK